jgi:peptide/nickel transport system substrate-binding protein
MWGLPDSARSTTFSIDGGCGNPDASGYDAYLGSQNLLQGQYNLADYSAPSVNSWLEQGATTSDRAKRFSLYSSVIKQLASDEPYVPLALYDNVVAISHKFKMSDHGYWTMQAEPYALDITPAT